MLLPWRTFLNSASVRRCCWSRFSRRKRRLPGHAGKTATTRLLHLGPQTPVKTGRFPWSFKIRLSRCFHFSRAIFIFVFAREVAWREMPETTVAKQVFPAFTDGYSHGLRRARDCTRVNCAQNCADAEVRPGGARSAVGNHKVLRIQPTSWRGNSRGVVMREEAVTAMP